MRSAAAARQKLWFHATDRSCARSIVDRRAVAERRWKSQLLKDAAAILGGGAVAADDRERIRELHEKIGELTVEPDS